jgi:hypothetical protein
MSIEMNEQTLQESIQRISANFNASIKNDVEQNLAVASLKKHMDRWNLVPTTLYMNINNYIDILNWSSET